MNKLSGKASQQLIKEMHLKRVFSIINDLGSIPRTDIKKITGLSATTVSSLVEVLISDNLVIETGPRSAATSGRKAVLLSVNKDGACFAGVSVLSSAVTINVYDLSFKLKTSKTFVINQDIKLGLQIAQFLMRITEAAGISDRIRGIAVGVPAVVDRMGQSIISSTVLNIKDENIALDIKNAFADAMVVVCNNSSLNAYAEKEFGKTEAASLIAIDIDDGVGAGIILNGNIYAGSNGLAGEFGHISVNYMGEKCKCNSRGCIELYLSVPAILKEASSLLSYKCNSLSDVKKELDAGNTGILNMVRNLARILSFGIINLNNIIDTEAVVICGSISVLGDYFLHPLKEYVREKLFAKADNFEVYYSCINEVAVALGGAKYVFDKLLIK